MHVHNLFLPMALMSLSIAKLIDLALPAFVRGLNPSGTGKESLAKLNVPVRCGGVEVRPGDIVPGDCDGVVAHKADQDGLIERKQAQYQCQTGSRKEVVL